MADPTYYNQTIEISKVPGRLSGDHIKMQDNPIAVGAPPWTPLGEVAALPRPLAGAPF